MSDMHDNGKVIYSWIRDLFPICRSLSGSGVLDTISYLQDLIPKLQVHSIDSGARVFDWTVPDEWNLRRAYIECPDGSLIADTRDSNLHVVGYSEPVNRVMTLSELNQHLYSLPDQPNAIPFVTSYYKRRWGFCLQDNVRKSLLDGNYRAKAYPFESGGSIYCVTQGSVRSRNSCAALRFQFQAQRLI